MALWTIKRPDDPAAQMKVRRRFRLDVDEGLDSDASKDGDDMEDAARYRPGGDLYDPRVVPPEELQ